MHLITEHSFIKAGSVNRTKLQHKRVHACMPAFAPNNYSEPIISKRLSTQGLVHPDTRTTVKSAAAAGDVSNHMTDWNRA